MNVIRAESLGMCFGVRDALRVAERVENASRVTIHGQLVHNEEVIDHLSAAGFKSLDEASRDTIPDTPLVLITAHGISDRERARLTSSGKELIDTTCPLVRRVHLAAKKLQDDDYFIIVIGRSRHVEVRGIVEDLERCVVIENIADVRDFREARLGIVCQTTTSPELALRIRDAIVETNPTAEVRFIDTICQPTRDNQSSLEEMLNSVDAVVVVGGKNSNNTKELVTLCRSRGTPAYHVQSAGDLEPDWFAKFENVGLTAGTSTLDPTIDAVHQRLEEFSKRGISP